MTCICDTCHWWHAWKRTRTGLAGWCSNPDSSTIFYKRNAVDEQDPKEACPWHERGTDEPD